MESQGRKEVVEAVVVASLCALATGIIGIGLQALANKLFPEKKEESKKDTSKVDPKDGYQ